MALRQAKKSIGGNTSVGPAATPKTPDNKRKSLAKQTPASNNKKPAPAPANPSPKKEKPSPPIPQEKKQGISAQFAKVSDKSKAIKKNNFNSKNKQNKNKNAKGQQNGSAEGQKQKQPANPQQKMSKKNRRQRLQAKLSAKPRSPLSQSRALKAEQEMNQSSNRILLVKIPDQPIEVDAVKKWSSSIENALFPKPIEPRTFLLVLKPDSNVKKEIENLKKISFGGGKISVEEKKPASYESKTGESISAADLIDPYTLYLTNLDESVTRLDLQELFPSAKTVMNPRKHNPRVSGSGTGTKFAFVGFESAEEALEGFKMSFNKKLKGDKYIVARFRRVGKGEVVKKEKDVSKVVAAVGEKRKAEPASPVKGVKKEDAKKSKVIKEEPKEEEDEDEDENSGDEDEDDDELEGEHEEGDDDDDDEDDGIDDEEDDDDDDDDDSD